MRKMVQRDLLRAAVFITVAAAWVQGCILVVPPPPSPNSPNPPQTQAPNPWPDQPLDPQPTPQLPSAVPQQSSTRFFTSRQSTTPPSVTTSQATPDMMNTSLILNNASTPASFGNTTFVQNQTSTKIPFTRPENSSVSTSSTTPRLPTSGSGHYHPHLSTTNHYTTSTIPDWWWWFNNPQVSSSTATTLKSSTNSEAFLSSSVSISAGMSENFTTIEYNSDFLSTLNTPTTSFDYSTNEVDQSTEESPGSTLEFTTSEDFTTTLGSNSMTYTDETSSIASTMHWLDNDTYSTNEVTETTTVTPVENSESTDSTTSLGSSAFVTNGPNTEESEITTMLQTSTNPDITTEIMDVTTFFENSTHPTSTPNDFSSSLSDDSVFSSDESIDSLSTYGLNNATTTNEPDTSEYYTVSKESPAVPFSTPMPNYPGTGEDDTIDPQYLTSTDPNSGASNSECPPIKFKKPPVYCKDSSDCKIDDDCKPGFSCCMIDPCGTKKCYETGGLERFIES